MTARVAMDLFGLLQEGHIRADASETRDSRGGEQVELRVTGEMIEWLDARGGWSFEIAYGETRGEIRDIAHVDFVFQDPGVATLFKLTWL